LSVGVTENYLVDASCITDKRGSSRTDADSELAEVTWHP
jgi:hypothetical protein